MAVTPVRGEQVAGIADALGWTVTVTAVPIPSDCTDGFNEAYFGRPERFLDPGAVQACSAWSFVAEETRARYVGRIEAALADGSWDARHGALRDAEAYEGSLVLIRSVR
ncbi:hypothetical protein [Streptomyces hokutonensis]|uniref:hypothetical protein n=1 Tax=Streptomyces hokutonensis TaxID=1306990 RepID=UPI00368D1BCA